MSDAMLSKRWMGAPFFPQPGPGTSRDDAPVPQRRAGRPRIPFVDRSLLAMVALVGGSIWLLASGPEPDAAPPFAVVELGRHAKHVESLAFARDGRMLASCSLDATVGVWSVDGGGNSPGTSRASFIASLPHPTSVVDAAFSPDGRMLVTVGFRALTFWSLGQGAVEVVAQLPGDLYRCLAFAPHGRTLAVGLIDGTIELIDMPGARRRSVIRACTDKIARLAFSPLGDILASTSMRGEVRLWDPDTGRERGRLGTGPARFHALAFAPDGRSLALAKWQCGEGDILLWDLEADRLRSRLDGHTDGVSQLAFSGDGRILASCGRDKTIIFWDPDAAVKLGMIRDVGGMVNALALTPDGTKLAFVAGDETVRLRAVTDLIPPRDRP